MAGDDGAGEAQTVIQIDAVRQKFARFMVYIKGWNLTLQNGTPMPLSMASIRRLNAQTLDAIDDALDAHIAKVKAGKAIALPTGAASSTRASGSEGSVIGTISKAPEN